MSCPRSVLRPPRDAQIVKPIPTGMIEFRHGWHDDLGCGYRPFPYQIVLICIYIYITKGSLKLDSLYANVSETQTRRSPCANLIAKLHRVYSSWPWRKSVWFPSIPGNYVEIGFRFIRHDQRDHRLGSEHEDL